MNIQRQIKTDRLNWEDVFQTSSANTTGRVLLKPFHAPRYCEIVDNSLLFFPIIHEDSPLSWTKSINRTLKPINDLSKKSIRILGEYGYSRFKEFLDDYKDGWNFGEGKALSEYSIALLDLFLNKVDSFPTEPSIFLTTEGYLQLIWEDKSGQEVMIDFSPTGFIYYIEDLDEEGEIQIEAVETLIRKVN